MLVFGIGFLLLAGFWLWRLFDAASMPVVVPPAVPVQAPVVTDAAATLVDDEFGVSLSGRGLRRIVQMLQWHELAHTPLLPDDELLREDDGYALAWSERMVDASRFARPQGHVNPPAPPYRSRSIGAGERPRVDAAGQDGWQDVAVARIHLPENLQAVFRPDGRWLTTAPAGNVPEAGDLRVRFEVLPTAAQAEGKAPKPPPATQTQSGHTDAALRWIVRAAAFILAMLGAGLVLLGWSRLASGDGWIGRLPAAAILALSAWVAATLVYAVAMLARPG